MNHLAAFRAAPLALAISLAFLVTGAHGQSTAPVSPVNASGAAVRTYHIAAGALSTTLIEIARQGGVAISVNPDLVKGLDLSLIHI